jgi:uncharacterized repeat protein (TIGR03987 family)
MKIVLFMLMYALISMILALLFYTTGVWSEKIQGELKKWHLPFFYMGLIFDTFGTTLMSETTSTGIEFNFHGIVGLFAIFLMLLHALWATRVLIKNDKKARVTFHKFSIIVWLIWLISFISGAIFGMVR